MLFLAEKNCNKLLQDETSRIMMTEGRKIADAPGVDC
jgi:hypothetical protein